MNKERVQVTTWAKMAAPTEKDLLDLLEGEGFQVTLWSRNAGHISHLHTHEFAKVIYVLRGRISYSMPESRQAIHLNAGDRVDLPAWVMHYVTAGPDGVDCIEGRRLEP